MQNAEIEKSTLSYNPQIDKKSRELYDEEYGIVVDDFNFDGEEDLAICNGHMGGYGASSYNIYLFDKTSSKFIENKKLTRFASDNLGLFFADPKQKLLTVYFKSGCCYHVTSKYQVVNNQPILVEEITEDATKEKELVTTKKLVNGSWVKKFRREKLSE